MKRIIMICFMAYTLPAFPLYGQSKGVYIGFMVFSGYLFDIIPGMNIETEKAGSFALFTGEKYEALQSILKERYLGEKRRGSETKLIKAAEKSLDIISSAPFPEQPSSRTIVFLTDGEEEENGRAGRQIEDGLHSLKKKILALEEAEPPLRSIAVEVRPSQTGYSENPKRKGFKELLTLAGGREENLFRLNDFDDPGSELSRTFREIARRAEEQEKPAALYFVLDISLSLLDRHQIKESVAGSVMKAIAALFGVPAQEGFVYVAPGTFHMGSDTDASEAPKHEVTLGGFYLLDHEVTVGEWRAVMGGHEDENPDLPITEVSWFDAIEFCNRSSEISGAEKVYTIQNGEVIMDSSKNGFRLPTEAEWEYAAGPGRGNTSKADANFDGDAAVPVKSYGKNRAGLYDMAGNVREWVFDYFSAYIPEARNNPSGPAGGAQRVMRGGSYLDRAENLRPAFRAYEPPGYRDEHVGFRTARTAISK
ncbi:MAG: formylglycine-generating enzyme family protein [Treponema sp.]|jgi:formylglycine-generating enzyme required for sulfatase activity|nr:formylglycine-generating enzyme family protein [Treponema sp.]